MTAEIARLAAGVQRRGWCAPRALPTCHRRSRSAGLPWQRPRCVQPDCSLLLIRLLLDTMPTSDDAWIAGARYTP